MNPTIGRIVHYVLGGGRSEGQHRPAIIIDECNHRFGVNGYTREECQLMVFPDGTNDGFPTTAPMWATSVPHDEETKAPGTWHWPERDEEEATRPGVEAEASAEHSEPAGIVPGHQPNGQRRES